MRKDGELHAEEDRKHREELEARHAAETAAYRAAAAKARAASEPAAAEPPPASPGNAGGPNPKTEPKPHVVDAEVVEEHA